MPARGRKQIGSRMSPGRRDILERSGTKFNQQSKHAQAHGNSVGTKRGYGLEENRRKNKGPFGTVRVAVMILPFVVTGPR